MILYCYHSHYFTLFLMTNQEYDRIESPFELWSMKSELNFIVFSNVLQSIHIEVKIEIIKFQYILLTFWTWNLII